MEPGNNYESRQGMNPAVIQKISAILAVLVFGGILFVIGRVFKDDIKKFQSSQAEKTFPQPKKMPAALNISVEEAFAKLEKAMGKKLGNELQPGLNKKEIMSVARENNIQLPEELLAFYSWHNGSEKSGQSLQWFVPFEEAMTDLKKKRTAVGKAKNSGSLNRMALSNMFAYRQNWVPLYRDSAYFSLNVDISRKPEDGAYFWAGSKMKGYYFFPSMQNAIVALAECFENKAFMAVKRKQKNGGIHERNDMVMDQNQKQLIVSPKRASKAMKKYGVYEKATGLTTH